MDFQLTSEFKPTGDQPKAIQQLTEGINNGEPSQVLLGATGTGKTFTMANVIQNVGKPTLVLCHNKTLAAQLYGEFKQFFPNNAVEYFISYYDYYQPEAYIASSDVFIEKDLAINEEIEKLRLHTTSALLSGRRDIVVVASVSCIYGIGNPEEFGKNVLYLAPGQRYSRNNLLYTFVQILYSRTEAEFTRGTFRVKGDTVDIFPAYADFAYRLYFFGDELEAIHRIDPQSGKKLSDEKAISLYPANLFVTGKDTLHQAINEIQFDMVAQHEYFLKEDRPSEAKRIKERTEFDLEMIRELGYCSGIENYSRYFDRRAPGARPFCLLDYFPDDFMMVIDESHVTVPQVRAMWGGDRSRKVALVEYGFRLPAAMDNRPLTFNEFESMMHQVVFVSATPGDYEMQRSEGVIVEQIIRPTGLLDPVIEVRPSTNQVDDLLDEIDERVKEGARVLVTTLTKRMSEELTKYLERLNIKAKYLHSEVKTLDRVEILRELRLGVIDVLVGVNLLREGLDLPEVSLVAILDADKEGFLRDQRSLIQTMGRAARNEKGKVIMYADRMTGSMQRAIDETNRRRATQIAYNEEHGITPRTILKSNDEVFEQRAATDGKGRDVKMYAGAEGVSLAAEPVIQMMKRDELEKLIKKTEKQMEAAAKDLDFLQAAKYRDELTELKNLLKTKRE
ncbi:excinuclease ABC subunit UvrB [Pontibacter diazotrophicus]|uniref:UvrABC system protein B n=1 Tax=Pontibacter diazotrophicus TaxID=1400979 RepID=A0A3D8LE35_9BACT|nr:excinuclease ABC subunit UvrB [Pontibacter diazotrophicus]RDV15668.1 excinuclease ABC subunit UvrB [Pontibacter diazotrophicus]